METRNLEVVYGKSLTLVLCRTADGYHAYDPEIAGLEVVVDLTIDFESCEGDERHVCAQALRAMADDIEEVWP